MTHHPHLHMIVPGGGISLDGPHWVPCRPGFLLPVRVLSRLFRRIFLTGLADAHAASRLAFFGELDGLRLRACLAADPWPKAAGCRPETPRPSATARHQVRDSTRRRSGWRCRNRPWSDPRRRPWRKSARQSRSTAPETGAGAGPALGCEGGRGGDGQGSGVVVRPQAPDRRANAAKGFREPGQQHLRSR